MRIQYEGLALPVSDKFSQALSEYLIQQTHGDDAITLNFKDPTYSAEHGGFHPVEIRLVKDNQLWHIQYITDFCYVGSGYNAELVKELDFDFSAGLFQSLFGLVPIEQSRDIYQIWEGNFLHYWKELNVFSITVS
ncbi:DUF2787 domain-containing protein [Alteromonadaceae bacterium M269]|nr:DUF2787 domain-containing protein [Alteromonadaceae bacterium M269]